jgi:hypothetical protein
VLEGRERVGRKEQEGMRETRRGQKGKRGGDHRELRADQTAVVARCPYLHPERNAHQHCPAFQSNAQRDKFFQNIRGCVYTAILDKKRQLLNIVQHYKNQCRQILQA